MSGLCDIFSKVTDLKIKDVYPSHGLRGEIVTTLVYSFGCQVSLVLSRSQAGLVLSGSSSRFNHWRILVKPSPEERSNRYQRFMRL